MDGDAKTFFGESTHPNGLLLRRVPVEATATKQRQPGQVGQVHAANKSTTILLQQNLQDVMRHVQATARPENNNGGDLVNLLYGGIVHPSKPLYDSQDTAASIIALVTPQGLSVSSCANSAAVPLSSSHCPTPDDQGGVASSHKPNRSRSPFTEPLPFEHIFKVRVTL